MGWSKADVFAGLLDPDDAARATAAFAAAYEAIVAAGDVGEIPGALDVFRRLRSRGVHVCLTTGFAPSTRDALLEALGWPDEVDLALSPGDVGRGRPTPDMILGAMDRLGVEDPGAVAVGGDAVSDLEAGTAGRGGAVIGVLSGAHDAGRPRDRATHGDHRRRPELIPASSPHPAEQGISTENETCSIISVPGPGDRTPAEDMTMDDAEHMRQAMALAAAVRSTTAPNPWVGSVIGRPTRSGRRARHSRGRRRRRRAPHEVTALAVAGEAARGGTLYGTLEPCAHQGRTAPCTDAIVAAGMARVVVGVEDPDPLVAGRGVAALRGAGLEVTVGRGGRRGAPNSSRPISSTAAPGSPG